MFNLTSTEINAKNIYLTCAGGSFIKTWLICVLCGSVLCIYNNCALGFDMLLLGGLMCINLDLVSL